MIRWPRALLVAAILSLMGMVLALLIHTSLWVGIISFVACFSVICGLIAYAAHELRHNP